jgi:hypothetical protein
LGSLLLNLAECINYLISNFIIIFDTDKLLQEIENSKKYGKNIIRNDIYKNLTQKKSILVSKDYFPPLRKGKILKIKDNSMNSNNTIDCNNNFFKSKTFIPNENQKHINTINNIKIEEIESINIYNNDNSKSVNNKLNSMSLTEENKNRFDGPNKNKYISSNDKLSERNSNKRIINHKKIEFWQYIIHLFYGKYKPRISEIEDFRFRILSEENLILNYLSVIKLLKSVKKLVNKQANEAIKNLDPLLN